MEYVVYHPQFGFMKTESYVLYDRKIAEGWKDYKDVKHELEPVVTKREKVSKKVDKPNG